MEPHAGSSATEDYNSAVLKLHLTFDPRVNFAMQQNDVPLIRQVRVENGSDGRIDDLQLHLWIEPELSPPWQRRIATIEAGATWNIDSVDLPLAPERLVNVTEREAATLHMEIRTNGSVLVNETRPLEVLAYNEWSGPTSLPENLAAFVLPNHPEVEQVLRAARPHLEHWTGSPAFDGYQSRDPRRARLQAAAIYAAIADLDVTYVSMPASFEVRGQKIHTPEQILQSHLGNCLDLTLLMAACMEQAGLHPLVVLQKGHAFPGLWITDRTLNEPTAFEALRLRKRVEIGEMCCFDSSAAASRPRVSFEQAEEVARLALHQEDEFLYAVDVRVARDRRILPLPIRVAREAYSLATPAQPEAAGIEAPAMDPSQSRLLDLRREAPAAPPSAGRDAAARRLDRWKARLLDLSLCNRLLNYRPTSRTLPLLCPDLATLSERLSAGQAFEIWPREDDEDPRDPTLHRSRTGKGLSDELLLAALAHGRLHADLEPTDLDRRQVGLWREARTTLEEMGANTLYLALGFLAWYETPVSTQQRLAPILLLPAELVRGTFGEPYRLRLTDEEPRINVTLLEKLKRDFNIVVDGLEELPQNESGVDVPLILDNVRRAVLEAPRWEVVEAAHAGLFSFTKFLMWLDLQARSATLMENAVVRHLVEGGRNAFPEARFLPPDQLDSSRQPEETFCPLDADSSQLAAVYAAEDEHSFVLQGPPGAGKSQTITNIISHSLARGRTVLFVSEKRAALEVVYRRLRAVGLSPFCLELHSNKTSKSEVMRQFREAQETTGAKAPSEWALLAQALQALRSELNAYVQALHGPRPLGCTVFEVTSALIGIPDAPQVSLQLEAVESLDRPWFLAASEAVSQLEAAARAVGPPQDHPWRGVERQDWSPELDREAHRLVDELAQSTGALRISLERALDALGLAGEAWSLHDLHELQAFCSLLLECPEVSTGFLLQPSWASLKAMVSDWIAHGRRRGQLWADLQNRYREPLLSLPLQDLLARFQEAEKALPPVAWLRLWSPRRILGRVAAVPLGNNPQITGDLQAALDLLAEDRYLEQAAVAARALFGSLWRERDTDWTRLEQILSWAEQARLALAWVSHRFPASGEAFREKISRLCSEATLHFGADRPLGRQLRDFIQAVADFEPRCQRLSAALCMRESTPWSEPDAPALLERILCRLQLCQTGRGSLRDWISYQRACASADDRGLAGLVAAHRRGDVPTDDLGVCFQRSLYEEWLSRVITLEEPLRAFHAVEHARKLQRFRALDLEIMKLTRSLVGARLAARIPSQFANAAPASEIGILLRELKKQKRHLPIRKLFEKLPNVLPRLKPCLLMSPLSVAQYLDPALLPFDLIVFDEASQIPAWDAIGAIARGQRVVVVGDSKQLPPTSFFTVGDSEDVLDDEEFEEAESILDECEASGMPRHLLRWHYRSRHESLIAFSNYHYYERRLLTFPSAASEAEQLGVKLSPVGGQFDRGASRTNRAEAEAVVATVVRRLCDPALRDKSIGVVTFNMPQQNLVEDLLDAARRSHPEIEAWFTDRVPEPVFVKNLENVQGDERDVILFSTTYGPDARGRTSVNFGPLNRMGGERRLNVAITRARELLLVFTSLRPDQIDLSRTAARGVAHLKTFLDYAARGPRAIQEAVAPNPTADYESPFEESVGQALESRGWTVHRQVGCSGYRIDLGVVHPDRPGSYLMGIECDGASYHSARAARDRDRLREEVLRGLGWTIHRIWSTEWWYDFEGEIEKLHVALETALEKSRRKCQEAAIAAATHEPEVAPDRPDFNRGESTAPGLPDPIPALPSTVSDGQRITRATPPTPAAPPEPTRPVVVYTPLPVDCMLGPPDAFYRPENTSDVRRILQQVMAAEAPVSVREAARRVAGFWGMQKVGSRIEQRVREVASAYGYPDSPRVRNGFFWSPAQDPATWREYRVHRDPESAREVTEIALEELANAAEVVLRDSLSLPREDLARETARIFGILRTGAKVRERLEQAIEHLARDERCKVDGAMVSVNGA